MRSALVYDLPSRIFHWLFSSLFLLSFIIAKTVDDESLTFSYHMLSGLLMGGLVVWRIYWGFFGSKHARFNGFNLNPLDLKDYFAGLISGSRRRWSGHNPASSWAAITMFMLALSLALTGFLMSTGGKETYEDIHEILANTFMLVVVMHVAGVLLHSLRHRDGIAFSMLDGKKEITENSGVISSAHNISAVFLLVLIISAGVYLFQNFDSQKRQLHMAGQTLQLGENEEGSINKNHQYDDDEE
jgi:cytochrome b